MHGWVFVWGGRGWPTSENRKREIDDYLSWSFFYVMVIVWVSLWWVYFFNVSVWVFCTMQIVNRISFVEKQLIFLIPWLHSFYFFFLNGSTRDTYISNRMTYYLLIFSGKNQKYSSRKEIWLEDKQKPIIHHQDGWYTDAVTFRIKCYFEHA